MKNGAKFALLLVAYIIKFLLSLIVTVSIKGSLIYITFSYLLYLLLIKNKNQLGNIIAFIMIDYLFIYYCIFNNYRMNITSIIISVGAFILVNGLLLFLIINNCIRQNKTGVSYFSSTQNIDMGLKALETEDYDKALESFSNAIRDYKKNYLGYMGMCNTLTKMDKKNLRKINYYKKKCLKYAPVELRKTIEERYK